MKVECSQIWKVKEDCNSYKLENGSYIVVLSKDGEYWTIGNFWSFGNKAEWGGARQSKLYEEDIKKTCLYFGILSEMVN